VKRPSAGFAERLRWIAELVAAAWFAAMFVAFILQVFTRYVLNDPTAWTQEATLICYLWVVFWCAAFLLRERDQITFDMVLAASPLPVRRILALLSTVLIGVAFVLALPATIDWIMFMKIERTPVLRVRFDWLYSVFVVFCIAVVVRAAIRVVRLLSPRWRSELQPPSEPSA
jgi:TRAP-type C4-dicarboxylate transport system permease small subunit